MSTVIDNRVVEMEFDNAQFEKGIKTSLKSLEDLKKGLELDKAVDSLSNLERAANKFDLSGIQNAVESLQNRFSTLGIIGMTALENITNKAINAGTALMKSLSVDQIASGMKKYESETSAIATMRYAIPEGTTEEGTKRIYEAIEKLQSYSDETSYSFSTMVDNMSKFIAAGVDLEKAETSMEGIANWAAKAGTSAQSANFGRVMYNLSQAMGQGTIKVSDWMSVETANMATKDFKEQVIQAAAAYGTLTENAGHYYTVASKGNKSVEVTAENMRTTLAKGWFTADVLTKVLGKYADRTTDFGKEAFLAAQQARTFTDAIEAAKDAVSTGWARTFRIIFGDINQATEFFTDLANAIISVTDMVQTFRNGVLEVWSNFGGRNDLIEAFWNIWNILRGIGRSMLDAFGLTSAGVVESMGKHLADVTHSFKETTEAVLGLFDAYTVLTGGKTSSESEKTTNKVVGDLSNLQKHAQESEKAVRGMINTGSVKMRPQTVETFTALADAYKDLDEYLASGEVTAEGLAQRLEKINQLNEEAGKTNKLMSAKKKALSAMKQELEGYTDISADTVTVSKETSAEIEDAEGETYYHSARLREVFKGIKDYFGIFIDTFSAVKREISTFAGLFAPLINPLFNLTSSVAMLISHVREIGVISDSVKGWVSQVLNAFSPLTDRIQTVVGWITTLQHAIYDRDYSKRSFFDESTKEFLSGPIGEKILNVANGIKSAIDIVVNALSSAIHVVSSFVSTFIMPLVGPAAMAVLDFFSGIGKAITGFSESIGSLDGITNVSKRIEEFFGSIRDNIVQSPVFQRAKTILSSFFKIFSTKPKAAVSYLKAVGRGLLEPVKNSDLYKKASAKIKMFGKGILATVKNSKALTKAKQYADTFFKVFKKDPNKAVQSLKDFGQNMLQSLAGSKPVQMLNSFREKVSGLFKNLLPSGSMEKAKTSASKFMKNLGSIFEKNGLVGALGFVKDSIVKKLAEWGRAFSESPIGQKIIEFKNSLVQTFSNLKKELQENEVVQRLMDFFTRIRRIFEANGLIGSLMLFKDMIVRRFNEIKRVLAENEIVKKVRELAQKISSFLQKIDFAQMIEKIKTFLKDFGDTFKEKGPIAAITRFKNALVQKISSLMSGVSVDGVIQNIKDLFSKMKESIENSDLVSSIDSLKEKIKEKLNNLFPKPSDEVGADNGGFLENIKNTILSWVDSLKQSIAGDKDGLFSTIADRMKKVFSEVSKFAIFALVAKIGLDFFKFISGIGKALGRLSEGGLKGLLKGKEKKGTDGIAKVLQNLAIAIAAIAGAILVFALIPAKDLQRAVNTMITCLTSIATFAAGVKLLGLEKALTGLRDAGIGVIAISLAILVLVGAINILSGMDDKVFIEGGKKLAILALGLAAFLVVTTRFGKSFNSSWASILAVAVAINLLIGPLKELVTMITTTADPAAIAGALGVMAGLMVGLGALIVVLGKFGNGGGLKQAATIYAIGKTIGLMADAFKKLGNLSTDQIIKGIVGMAAIVGAFFVLTKFAPKDPMTIGTMFAALIAVVGTLFVFTEALKRVVDIPADKMVSFAASFAIFMLSFSVALGIMALIPFAAAVSAAAGLAVAIVAIGAVLALAAKLGGNAAQGLSENMFVVGSNLSSFSEMVSGLDTGAINTAIQCMKDFASAAVEVAGMDYSGLDNFRVSMLRMGSGLKLYSSMTSDISAPDKDPLRTIADNLKAVHADMVGLTDIGDISSAIVNIGAAARLYYSEIGGIDTSKGVADLTDIGKAFSDLSANMPDQSSIEDISSYAAGGNNDLTNFALGITAIGSAFEEFGKISESVNDEKVTAATTALDRIKTLSESMSSDKVDFSFLGILKVHRENLTSFPEDVVLLGDAIKSFATSVTAEGVDLAKVTEATGILDKFVEIKQKLEPVGGIVDWFKGRQDLGTFASSISTLGDGIARYADKIAGKDFSNAAASVSPLKALSEVQNAIGTTGGLAQLFSGVQSLSSFGSELGQLGEGVAGYADAIQGRNFDNAEASVGPLLALARAHEMINSAPNWASLDSFGDSITSIGTKLAQFQTDTMSIDANRINLVVAAINSLLALGQEQSGANDAENGARNIFNFLKGLTDKQGGLVGIGGMTIADLAGGLASDFVTAFNTGLASGEALTQIQAGYLGQSAYEGAKAWLSNFTTVGSDAANLALKEAGTTIANASSSLSGNSGSEFTIRPVLDLTDVQNGLAGLNSSLFGNVDLSASLAEAINSESLGIDQVVSELQTINSSVSSLHESNSSHMGAVENILRSIHSMEGVINSSIGNIRVTIDYGSIDAGLGDL